MRQPSDSALKLYASLTAAQQRTLIATAAAEADVSLERIEALLVSDWEFVARPKQIPTEELDWTYWFWRCGRGFGKTISAAQWVKKKALARPKRRIALIAPTGPDGRSTMVEGETGLLSIMSPSDLRGGTITTGWNKGAGQLFFSNGSRCQIFSSETPDRLRGPQHHFAWCEEVSSWNDAKLGDSLETTWSNMKLGLRLGEHPQAVVTSTPKANKLTKELLKLDPKMMRVVTGSSYENRDNLSESWWDNVVSPYEGTRLGRQEIYAELLEDVEGALWTLSQIDDFRVTRAPELERIVVALDPNASSKETADDAGIIVVGKGRTDKKGYVLADRTTTSGGPAAWGVAAVNAYYEFEADRIVAEANNGGEMVRLVIKQVDPTVPIKLVHATRGKRTRAEPIAAMYESVEGTADYPVRGVKVHHVGAHEELEEEMTTWDGDGESPNRMDALVWGLWELLIQRQVGKAKTSMPKGRIPGVRAPGSSYY